MPDAEAWIVREGQDVLGSDGKRIGSVTGSAGNTLVVKHGRFFGFLVGRELYVPASAITAIDREAIYLNVPANVATKGAWGTPPADVTTPATARPEVAPATSESSDASWQISEGMQVLGADGERIGEVSDGDAESISVRMGRLFSRTVQIPAGEITDVRGQAVHVRTTRAALEQGDVSSGAAASPTGVSATDTLASAAPAAATATSFSDLQGRITNAWRNGDASATPERESVEQAAAPADADQVVADPNLHAQTFSAAPMDSGADLLDQQSGEVAHPDADTTQASVTSDTYASASVGSTSTTGGIDLSDDTPDADAGLGNQNADLRASGSGDEHGDGAHTGLLDSLRTKIGDFLDRPTDADAAPADGDTTVDTGTESAAQEVTSATEPDASGVLDTVRGRVGSFLDSPTASADAQDSASSISADADAAIDGATTDANPESESHGFLSDIKERVSTFLDNPDEDAVTAADDTLDVAASAESSDASRFDVSHLDDTRVDEPTATTTSRFSVVSDHGEDDDLISGLPDDEAGEDAPRPSDAGTDTAPYAYASDTEYLETSSADDAAVASAGIDGGDDADAASRSADDEAISLDALAEVSPSEGSAYEHIGDEAIAAESPESTDTGTWNDAAYPSSTTGELVEDLDAGDPAGVMPDLPNLSDLDARGDEDLDSAAGYTGVDEDTTLPSTAEADDVTDADATDFAGASASGIVERGINDNAGTSASGIVESGVADGAGFGIDDITDNDVADEFEAVGDDIAVEDPGEYAADVAGIDGSTTDASEINAIAGETDEVAAGSGSDLDLDDDEVAFLASDDAGVIPSADAGDSTIANNARTSKLANAADIVAESTKQDRTIADNALHGTLSDGDTLARSWASSAAAATRSGAEAHAAGNTPDIEGATPLAADWTSTDATAADADTTDGIDAPADSGSSGTDDSGETGGNAASTFGPAESEGIDWVAANADGSAPNDWTVKGNANSGIYHTPESSSYQRTVAEVWFPDGAAAERAGYRAPRSMQAGSASAAAARNAADAALAGATAEDDDASSGATSQGYAGGSTSASGESASEVGVLGDTTQWPDPVAGDVTRENASDTDPSGGLAGDDAGDGSGIAGSGALTDDDTSSVTSGTALSGKTTAGPAETEGIDWVAAVEGEDAPSGWTVKGNANSGIYHTLASSSYQRTVAEVWFPDAEAAERAGYRAPRSLHHAGSEAAAATETTAHAVADRVSGPAEDAPGTSDDADSSPENASTGPDAFTSGGVAGAASGISDSAGAPVEADEASTSTSGRESRERNKRYGPAESEGVDWIHDANTGAEHGEWLIKGNANSGIYHTPESPSYESTVAEVWFPDTEAAKRSGYRPPRYMPHLGAEAAASALEAARRAKKRMIEGGS